MPSCAPAVTASRVARLMRQESLRARPRRRYVVTTQSRHKHPVAPNLVKRQFTVAAPNQVWVSDLTYLRTLTGFVFLAVVLDLYSRRVVGWSVSADADAGVAVEALRRALVVRPAPAGMIHHSDRGVHYACGDYRAALAERGITSSMSRKGDCWDNAVAESFFSTLAFELERDARWYDVHHVERDLVEYIDSFYNPTRRHSRNRYLSPVDFERRFHQEGIAA
jgi:putative transposase